MINIGDRVRISPPPSPPILDWLSGEYGFIEAALPNDLFVVKLDRQISQKVAIDLGYGEGYAVIQRANLAKVRQEHFAE
jgi:hypothetical protein